MPSTFERFCTGGHDRILHGRASSDVDAIGTFFQGLPMGSEVYSTDPMRRYRWTGTYQSYAGHLSVVLQRLDGTGNALIHTCLSNVWIATGKVVDPPAFSPA